MEVYDRKHILGYWKTRLMALNGNNKEDALAFVNNLEHEGISELRIARYARMLMILDKVGDSKNVGRKGVERFLDLISNYDIETRNMFIVILKRFYKWLLAVLLFTCNMLDCFVFA